MFYWLQPLYCNYRAKLHDGHFKDVKFLIGAKVFGRRLVRPEFVNLVNRGKPIFSEGVFVIDFIDVFLDVVTETFFQGFNVLADSNDLKTRPVVKTPSLMIVYTYIALRNYLLRLFSYL